MSKERVNFDGLDEATLLAFVESSLGREAEASLRQSVTPATLAALEAMRRDRAGVAGLAEVAPVMMPSGMVEAAMARAHREALHGLRVTEAEEAAIPVSRVVPVRSRWLTPGRAALAAAAVLGVAGGLTLMAVWPSGGAPKPKIAWNPGPVDAVPAPTHEPAVDVVAEGPGVSGGVDEPREAVASAEPVVVPLARPGARVDESARALALARGGRLVFKVTARTPGRASQQLAALEARSATSQTWRARAEAPGAVVAALSKPASEPKAPGVPGVSEPGRVASVDGWSPLIVRPRAEVSIAPPPGAQDLVAVVRVAPTAEAIEAVRAVLSEQVGSVAVAELAEPVAAEEEGPTIESVLWWAGSPAQWAPWASIPVIIER